MFGNEILGILGAKPLCSVVNCGNLKKYFLASKIPFFYGKNWILNEFFLIFDFEGAGVTHQGHQDRAERQSLVVNRRRRRSSWSGAGVAHQGHQHQPNHCAW